MPAASGPENPDADPLADDRALWSLLERAPRPPAGSPFFDRRVLRAVACFEAERAKPAWRRRWEALVPVSRPRFAGWPGVSYASVAAAVFLTLGTFGAWSRNNFQRARPAAPSVETLPRNDAEVVAHLDELTETNENVVWLDEDDDSAS